MMLSTFFVAVAITCLANINTTVYLHRSVTHAALKLHPVVAEWCKFWNWITTAIVPVEWAAVHRKHHKFTDVEGDPHSPYLEGLWRVLFFNVFYYRREARNPGTVKTFCPDIIRSQTWFDRYVYSRGFVGPIVGISFLCLILGSVQGLLVAVIHGFLYIFVCNPLVNALCHYPHRLLAGYQNYPDKVAGTAYNNPWVAAITAGEGLHNNHHEDPACACLARRGWEVPFDHGWWVVVIFERLGLATKVNRGAKSPRS